MKIYQREKKRDFNLHTTEEQLTDTEYKRCTGKKNILNENS